LNLKPQQIIQSIKILRF